MLQDLEEARRYRARLAAVARAVQHTYHEHASRGGEDGRAEMGEKRKRAIDEDRGHEDHGQVRQTRGINLENHADVVVSRSVAGTYSFTAWTNARP